MRTFFVIGGQAAQNPEIIRQSWQDGNETRQPYLYPPAYRAGLAVARGAGDQRHPARHRKPHRAYEHALPPAVRRVAGYSPSRKRKTLRLMQQMMRDGFVIVGMNIDPKDYLSSSHAANPNVPIRIAEHIALRRTVGRGPAHHKDHIILLHDGGRRPRADLRALPLIIQRTQGTGLSIRDRLAIHRARSARETLPAGQSRAGAHRGPR